MGQWLVEPPVALSEPTPVQEILINGPGGVFYENGMLMMPCYRDELMLESPDAPPERVVKFKMLIPLAELESYIGMLRECARVARHLRAPAPLRQRVRGRPSLNLVKAPG